MSGIYLLIVFGVWAGLTSALWKGWRRWRVSEGGNRRRRDAVALVIALLWFGASFWHAGGQKIYYDLEVKRLCARDGGVKVYETVKLPAEVYDAYARRNWILPDKVQAKPGDEYYYEVDRHYYRKGEPQMMRRQAKIIRRSDGKVLGEMVRYGRGGGDLPGPWHPSSFTCPRPTEGPYLEPSVFQKGEF